MSGKNSDTQDHLKLAEIDSCCSICVCGVSVTLKCFSLWQTACLSFIIHQSKQLLFP